MSEDVSEQKSDVEMQENGEVDKDSPSEDSQQENSPEQGQVGQLVQLQMATGISEEVGFSQPLQIFQAPDGSTQILGVGGDSLQALDGYVITLSAAPGSIGNAQVDEFSSKIWQVLPSTNNSGVTHIIAVGQADTSSITDNNEVSDEVENDQKLMLDSDTSNSISSEILASMLLPNPPTNQLLADAPTWAVKLRNCEVIGDSFRGWVSSEVELDIILTLHKTQTGTFWGTRQSPSVQRNSTRLMWKSQYVPFDGIPFINFGSRAIVMECQFGPRRKGNTAKKQGDGKSEFKQTCPARIYIKKVKKFPKYAVSVNTDKKNLRIEMDRAFQRLRYDGSQRHGDERWYVQLPTIAAHEFHSQDSTRSSSSESIQEASNSQSANSRPRILKRELAAISTSCSSPEPPQNGRVHAQVAEKIRELVQNGEARIYVLRKQLRKYVEREMFKPTEMVPERHNVCFFPTVHDIQNHVFKAIKDIENGTLPLLAQDLRTDGNSSDDGNSNDALQTSVCSTGAASNTDSKTQVLWMQEGSQSLWTPSLSATMPQVLPGTITVTLMEPDQDDETNQDEPQGMELICKNIPSAALGSSNGNSNSSSTSSLDQEKCIPPLESVALINPILGKGESTSDEAEPTSSSQKISNISQGKTDEKT